MSLMQVSLCVGVISTALNMPFDAVKTQMQKAGHPIRGCVMHLIKMVYQTSGVRGLYAGWQVRLVQYMVQSVFTVSILEHLERKFA